MACRNLSNEREFFTRSNHGGRWEDYGHCRTRLTSTWLLLHFHSLVFGDSEALNIPRGWRHLRKPPCGRTFHISGRQAWLLVFFFAELSKRALDLDQHSHTTEELRASALFHIHSATLPPSKEPTTGLGRRRDMNNGSSLVMKPQRSKVAIPSQLGGLQDTWYWLGWVTPVRPTGSLL